MRSKRIPAEEQYRLIMECRQSGLTDHQWCVEHDIKPGTFYNWVKRLRQKGCVDLPGQPEAPIVHQKARKLSEGFFADTDPIPYQLGVRPHKEKINISKEFINKTRRAVAPYAARMNHTPLRGEQQATVL